MKRFSISTPNSEVFVLRIISLVGSKIRVSGTWESQLCGDLGEMPQYPKELSRGL